MKVVRTKSIGNVEVDRLQDSLAQIHAMVHTPEGLHAWDRPRRQLYNYGVKALAIRNELVRRGQVPVVAGCQWCSEVKR